MSTLLGGNGRLLLLGGLSLGFLGCWVSVVAMWT